MTFANDFFCKNANILKNFTSTSLVCGTIFICPYCKVHYCSGCNVSCPNCELLAKVKEKNNNLTRKIALEEKIIISLGMMAENMQRQSRGESMAYVEKDFLNLIN